jgi:hypothetical protein
LREHLDLWFDQAFSTKIKKLAQKQTVCMKTPVMGILAIKVNQYTGLDHEKLAV